jgi:hypothetical protein
MKPAKIEFFVYVENDAEAAELSKSLFGFVDGKRQMGIAVTAKALMSALDKFKDNHFLNSYLKNHGR